MKMCTHAACVMVIAVAGALVVKTGPHAVGHLGPIEGEKKCSMVQ